VLNELKKDATLKTLLNGRIYPDVAQVKTLPTVIMSADSPTSPINEPWAYVQNLTFEIYAKTEKSAQDVRNRIYELLQQFDNYFLTDQASGIIVHEAHAVYATVSNHFPLENEQAKEKVVSFDIKFTKCA
jgi:hypothetical protein